MIISNAKVLFVQAENTPVVTDEGEEALKKITKCLCVGTPEQQVKNKRWHNEYLKEKISRDSKAITSTSDWNEHK